MNEGLAFLVYRHVSAPMALGLMDLCCSLVRASLATQERALKVLDVASRLREEMLAKTDLGLLLNEKEGAEYDEEVSAILIELREMRSEYERKMMRIETLRFIASIQLRVSQWPRSLARFLVPLHFEQ